MDSSARDIADRFTKAITFPEVILQLDDMLNDGMSNTADFAQLISRDPGLTATLLKFANSALYGFSGNVATVERAISLVGMREIRDLVLSVAIKTTFGNISNKIVSMEDFWRHSLCCGLACRRIAETVRANQREVLFTAGLLHDIGQLAMFDQIPEACEEVLVKGQYRPDEVEMYQLEREFIGFDHQEVGIEIAAGWRFPAVLGKTMQYHHIPEEAPEYQFESAVVHVGNALSVLVELEMDGFSNGPQVSPWALEKVGLEEDQLMAMIPHIQATFNDMRPVFGIAA